MNNNELDWNKSSSDCCEKMGFEFVGLWGGRSLYFMMSLFESRNSFIYSFIAWSRWDFLPESFVGDKAVCSCNLHACSLRNVDGKIGAAKKHPEFQTI